MTADLAMLASALSRRDLRVEHAAPGERAWTNGAVIFVDPTTGFATQLQEICAQAALLAAGSLDRAIVQRFVRRPALAKRYLAIEGPRALAAIESVLPPVMRSLIDRVSARRADSPAASLDLALGRETIADPAPFLGSIRPRELLAMEAAASTTEKTAASAPRQPDGLRELSDEAERGEEVDDVATSPASGGGGLGRLLQKMLDQVRQLKGGGSPGADAATHISRSGVRGGVRALRSTTSAESIDDTFGKGAGVTYPEWDVHRRVYKADWCTVQEIAPPAKAQAAVAWLEGFGLRRPLSRLGMGLDRFRRQRQGDDIDIDAAIEAQVDLAAGVATDESFYVESQRHRRDLSVLILLDISGSVTQEALSGRTVHEQQRSVAAELATVLYEIGDRVALYAFHSQGRSAVHVVPVKRFDESLGSAVMSRLQSLIPGAYSRLGAAIRHGARLLIERSGTSRRLLVVLSDGLAYDHGYEPVYGAADARHALGEARREGVGCLCLSVGAGTNTEVLRRVFGSAAHATIPEPRQLGRVIGPLFRAALGAAEVRRRINERNRRAEEA